MLKSIYITTSRARSGKSAIVLGVMALLLRDLRKVGFFRPIINPPEEGKRDHDINLVLSHFYLGLRYEETYGYTMKEAKRLINSGKQSELMEGILNKYNQLVEKCDFVLCEGTDYTEGNEAFEFDLNSEISANLGCPALVVLNGHDATVEEIMSQGQLTIETLKDKGADIFGAIVNRANPEDVETLYTSLRGNVRMTECPECLFYVIPEVDALALPTMADVQKWIGAEVLHGREAMDNQIDNYAVAAMQICNFLNYIKKGSLVITPGDRSDIILSCMATRHSSSFPDIAGILLTGGILPTDNVLRLIDGWTGVPVPILLIKDATYPATMVLNRLYGKIDPEDTKRIASALGTFEASVDTQELRERLIRRKSVRVTPRMFEFSLIQKAKKNRQHIVLPEGTGSRILKATDILLRRDVCDLTLLGRRDEIEEKAAKLGLSLAGANIVEPEKSSAFDRYAECYYEIRKKKGVTPERAWDMVADNTVFGTMMIHMGDADGMVSGSVNTTANTITPALRIIKTKPGAAIVSSVFLMCLKDRVLAFGDCAINTNPTAEQLAEIAISSAETAKIFGIEPRVAMLSYSTGTSGKGVDVDKVVEARAIAKEKRPDLLIAGPIQYDAAIDQSVAKTKLPDSKVAGRATVFIFPDLNTGNNTYKAVQRASDQVVAIGPVLQGLAKPVNDLSRGCTVPDIVNTVAITAVQAQAGKNLLKK